MSFMFTLLRTWFCFWKGGGCVTVIACFVVYSTSPHILIEFGIGDQDNSYKTILRLYLFRDDSFHLSSRYNLFLLLVEALQDRAACKEVQHFMSMSRLHYKRWEDCLKGTKRMFCWILSTWTWTLVCFNGWVTDVGRLWRPQDLMSLTASMWRKSCWKVTWMSAPSLKTEYIHIFSYIRGKKNISKTYPFLHSLQQRYGWLISHAMKSHTTCRRVISKRWWHFCLLITRAYGKSLSKHFHVFSCISYLPTCSHCHQKYFLNPRSSNAPWLWMVFFSKDLGSGLCLYLSVCFRSRHGLFQRWQKFGRVSLLQDDPVKV